MDDRQHPLRKWLSSDLLLPDDEVEWIMREVDSGATPEEVVARLAAYERLKRFDPNDPWRDPKGWRKVVDVVGGWALIVGYLLFWGAVILLVLWSIGRTLERFDQDPVVCVEQDDGSLRCDPVE